MASLRKLRGKYYARVYTPESNSKEKLIPLLTDSKLIARKRQSIVESVESEIKAGQSLVFPWQNETGEVEEKRLTLGEAIAQYLKTREGDGLREGTLVIYRNTLKHFRQAVGKRFPVDEIKLEHIDQFKQKFVKQFAVPTMNMNLRSIKTFLMWLKDADRLSKVPKIKMLNGGKPLPIYVNNGEFRAILGMVEPHYQRAFYFYRETGCRLAEPFQGELNGNFLTIKAETAKGHSTRDIYLTPELKEILLEMREVVNRKVKQGKATLYYAIKHYSRVFHKACKACSIDGRKFHSLRHTFAVRFYLTTGDIYKVAKQLGHSSVTTTEIYARYDVKRLQQDFPDLVKEPEGKVAKTVKQGKIAVLDTELTDTLQVGFV